ncbi:single strand DNA binding protein [Acinetobacter phage Presley]|uniref:Single stranded DNA-binding protein n=1 Tax=Acinetobacter phage Presley TaxID=1406780 RepID=U5PWK9_9CAUD|nr:single strand DNA binding protein [Acinetobacter phage Presley]AGY48136.1 single stranded DNA-binding protein [Acinetobacter phage Presley]
MGFKLKTAKDVEEAQDTVGGSIPLESNVYPMVLKNAYVHVSDKGAQALNIEIDIDNGKRTQRQSLWVSDAEGKNYYEDSKGKKKHFAGYLLADSLAMLATGGEASIDDLDTEEKIIQVYDSNQGKEVNKKVEAFTDLIGLEFQGGLIKHIKPKSTKVGDEYVDDPVETITINELDKVFSEDGFTTIELIEEAEEPAFIHTWLTRWEGKAKTTKPKDAAKGRSAGAGRSNARTAAAPRGKAAPAASTGKRQFFKR